MVSKIQEELGSTHPARKRSYIDIMANICAAAHRGVRKTRIMYQCNLSYNQLQTYLRLLVHTGFIEPARPVSRKATVLSRKHAHYHTTPKGQAFLDAYRHLQALLP